jgi:hypothetical protein
MMVASGEWARWRGPRGKKVSRRANRQDSFPPAGVGGQWFWYPGSHTHTPGPVLTCLVQPERDPAGPRWSPERRLFSLPERRLHQHHLQGQRTLHRLVPTGLDALRHMWFVSRLATPQRADSWGPGPHDDALGDQESSATSRRKTVPIRVICQSTTLVINIMISRV